MPPPASGASRYRAARGGESDHRRLVLETADPRAGRARSSPRRRLHPVLQTWAGKTCGSIKPRPASSCRSAGPIGSIRARADRRGQVTRWALRGNPLGESRRGLMDTFLPVVERRDADAELPAELGDAQVRLPLALKLSSPPVHPRLVIRSQSRPNHGVSPSTASVTVRVPDDHARRRFSRCRITR